MAPHDPSDPAFLSKQDCTIIISKVLSREGKEAVMGQIGSHKNTYVGLLTPGPQIWLYLVFQEVIKVKGIHLDGS